MENNRMNLEEKILDLLSKSARPLCLQEIATELSLPGDRELLSLLLKLDKEHKIQHIVKPLGSESNPNESTYYYKP
nr:MAG TPA: hypothetical protein [Caudoviricetes sp.]